MKRDTIGKGIVALALVINVAGAMMLLLLKPEYWALLGLPPAFAYVPIIAGVVLLIVGLRIQKSGEPPESGKVQIVGKNWWKDKIGGVICALGAFLFIMAVILRRTMTPEAWAASGLPPAIIIVPMIGGAALFFVGMRILKTAETKDA